MILLVNDDHRDKSLLPVCSRVKTWSQNSRRCQTFPAFKTEVLETTPDQTTVFPHGKLFITNSYQGVSSTTGTFMQQTAWVLLKKFFFLCFWIRLKLSWNFFYAFIYFCYFSNASDSTTATTANKQIMINVTCKEKKYKNNTIIYCYFFILTSTNKGNYSKSDNIFKCKQWN